MSSDQKTDVLVGLTYETKNGEPLSWDEYPDTITISAPCAAEVTHKTVCKAVDEELLLSGLNRENFVVIWRVLNPPFCLTLQ